MHSEWIICRFVGQILLIQIKCFHEIITIGYVVYRSHELPWFRTLSWYFLITSNYFFYGESMVQYFGVFMSRTVWSFQSFTVLQNGIFISG